MEPRILIAIDLSENSLKAVDYVGKMLSCHTDSHVTLLNIIKEPSEDIMPEPIERQKKVERDREGTLLLMEQAARRLISQNIPEKHVHLKIQVCGKQFTISNLILNELKLGKYDTIVVGRRGVSKREEFLFGSVSNSVVREAKGCTVWVVE